MKTPTSLRPIQSGQHFNYLVYTQFHFLFQGKLSRTKTSTGDEQSGNSQSVVCTATTAIKSCNSGANNNEALHSIPVASSNITKNQNTNNYSEGDVEIDADDSIQSENLLNDEVVLLSNRTDNRK
ncbi:hypothetical protein KSF78_0009513 [Schistosoma japonicum]|nr:hypothetical protein KSF78_0009513 [Schistosoma japonicum]